MPRIAHLGDLHIRHDNRLEDTLACLDHAIDDAIAHEVDLFVQAGDVFDTKSTPIDRNAFADRVKRMAAHAPVVIIYGNHDKHEDLDIFAKLDTTHPVLIADRPWFGLVGGVQVFAFPHFDKSNAAAMLPAGLSIAESEDAMVQAVGIVLQHWRGILHASRKSTEGGAVELFSNEHVATYPAIFLGHLTIAGSLLSNGEPHPAQGIQLSISDLDQLGFDAVMLGHIHKAQTCDAMGLIRYAGSISRANFGESQDPKGWWLWDIPTRGEDPRVEFREVPARRMVTIPVDWSDEFAALDHVAIDADEIRDAEVRVRITVPEDRQAEAATFKAFAQTIVCHSMQIEIRTIPVSRVRAGEIATALTPEDKLRAFWTATECPDAKTQQGVLAKLAELVKAVA